MQDIIHTLPPLVLKISRADYLFRRRRVGFEGQREEAATPGRRAKRHRCGERRAQKMPRERSTRCRA